MLNALALHDNGIPIYVQLRDQIAAAVGRGLLAPGQRLPTMREVAVALAIDLNTVQRAYGELERDGLVTMVRGRGSFVAAAPPPPRNRRAETRALAANAAAQAHAGGIDLHELVAELARLAARS